MSLILEALRKSEAERRRGLAPDVAMELPPTPNPQTRATPAWTWPLLALLLAIGVLGWWLWRDATPPAPKQPTTASPEIIDAPTVPPPQVVVRRSRPAPAPTTVPATATPPVRAATTAAPLAAANRIGIAPPAPHAPPPATATPPPRAAPAPAASPTPAQTSAAATASLPDLDATGLPPVKLSMHVWNEAPARRFVILDGQRMTEGDRLGGLQVIEIRRDGVVIERDGQRARVPLR